MFLALYGDKVNIGEAVFISIFSMAVVFVVLLIISYMIDLVAVFLKKPVKAKAIAKNETAETIKGVTNDASVVAAIAAAISSYMGVDPHNLVIKKIRRIDKSFRRK